jgi:hypothetical protein
MWRPVLLASLAAAVICVPGCKSLANLAGTPKTTIAITNKISTLAAGDSYEFAVSEDHDQGAGFTVKLNGQGTLVQNGFSAFYLAPSSPPMPDSVTVTVKAANGSGVSDSDTFTITAAPGPVVSISPATFSATAGGAPVALNVSVTMDSPSDTLTGGTSGSPACGGICGSLGPFSGTPGGGAYTVSYTPPASVTMKTQQQVAVFSNLANSTSGTAYVTINP